MKKLVATLLCFTLFIETPVWAASLGAGTLSLSGEIQGAPGSEYVSGSYPGAILMPVNLWGSIAKAGIHHIPTKTDLVTLLSLAGGPGADAELSKILIKRRMGGQEQVLRIDAMELLEKPGVRSPILEANDIIVIPRYKPVISADTLTIMSFAGSLISIVLAGFVIANQVKK